MSTTTIYIKRGVKITVRSDRKAEYSERLAKDVKVDQTVKLSIGRGSPLRLYSVLKKVAVKNGDTILTVRYLPPFRNETKMLAVVERARDYFTERGGMGVYSSNIKLDRPEKGIYDIHVELKQETLRYETTCSCCGGALNRGELAFRAFMTPANRKAKFKVAEGKEQRNTHRHFHFHNCMTPAQNYNVCIVNEDIEHVTVEKLRLLNDKAFLKARDFQLPWVALSVCRSHFMFAYDTRSLVSVFERMAAMGTPVKFLCRVTRTSLNMEQPMSEEQFNFLVNHDSGKELNQHLTSGFKYVTCAETIDTQEAIYKYANTVDEIQTACMLLRASDETSCYGFASIQGK